MTDTFQAPAAVGSVPGHNGAPEFRPTNPPLPGFEKFQGRVCPECQQPFGTDKSAQVFCSEAHKLAFHNRSSAIGRVIVPLAMAWRAGRNHKGGAPKAKAYRATAARAFGDLCAAIDVAVADDTANGRLPKLDYLRGRAARNGTLHRAETIAWQTAEIARLERELAKARKALEAAK